MEAPLIYDCGVFQRPELRFTDPRYIRAKLLSPEVCAMLLICPPRLGRWLFGWNQTEIERARLIGPPPPLAKREFLAEIRQIHGLQLLQALKEGGFHGKHVALPEISKWALLELGRERGWTPRETAKFAGVGVGAITSRAAGVSVERGGVYVAGNCEN